MRPLSVALILVILLSVVAAIFIENHHAEAHRGYARVNGGDGLRLREGPGAEYRIITVMPHQARIKFFGHRGNWAKVRYLATGQVGWTWLAYLVPETAPTSGGGGGGSPGGLQTCFPNSWGQVFCAPPDMVNAAWSAAQRFGASYWWLMSIASCESNFSQYAYNGLTGVSGVMQFLPSTFYAYGGSNIWSYWEQFYVAAFMYSRGLAFHWDCNHRI
jgi:hypothetical protein